MLVIIIGVSCTGKTSINKMFKEMGYHTIEASSYYKSIKAQHTSKQTTYSLTLGALTALDIIEKNYQFLEHSILTGIRSVDEYHILKENIFRTVLVVIKSDYLDCYNRAKQRNREEIGSFESFLTEIIYPDLEYGIKDLMNMADITILNRDISLADFLQSCKEKLEGYVIQ